MTDVRYWRGLDDNYFNPQNWGTSPNGPWGVISPVSGSIHLLAGSKPLRLPSNIGRFDSLTVDPGAGGIILPPSLFRDDVLCQPFDGNTIARTDAGAGVAGCEEMPILNP